tara:strand:- start:12633 stop:14204 length:1572 start_codon:yes stop_codon:yes gene_type:complete
MNLTRFNSINNLNLGFMNNYYTITKLLALCLSFFYFTTNLNAQTYVNQPYYTGFETGTLGAEWTTNSSLSGGYIQPTQSGVYTWSGSSADAFAGNYYLAMHYPPGATFNTNQADLHMDLQGESGLRIYFKWSEWNDETHAQDGLYISDDGGTSFVKVLDFDGDGNTDLNWVSYNMSLDSINSANGLTFTNAYVIRFQQYDDYYLGGGNDGFLIDELSVLLPCNSTNAISESTCSAYTVPSGDETYTSSGVYTDTIPNAAGCDSIISIDLTILNSTASITESACETYTVPSGDESYTTSGTYNDTIPNSAGCDSIITIDLTINQTSQSTTTITACGSYEWTDGNTYSSSGTYTQTLQNVSGCDSVATLDLTIDVAPVMSISSSNNVDLSAVGTADSLAWIDCDNQVNSLSDEVDFTPAQNGNYAVIGINDNGCRDTSDCFSVTTVSLNEESKYSILIYPNPASDFINVNVENAIDRIEIRDLSGRLIISTTDSKIDISELSNGTYVIKAITMNGDQYIEEIIKN